METENLLIKVARVLRKLDIPYLITGGTGRKKQSTIDIFKQLNK